MENETELQKLEAAHTDMGFSEAKLAKQIDLGVSPRRAKVSQIFTAKKTTQIVFQAQKDEEK
jgi:hypothetical protein